MKHLLWPLGVNPLVIPNGIPRRLLRRPDTQDVACLRRGAAGEILLSKVGRWDPDKRWIMAVETVAALRGHGHRPVLVTVGGIEPHRGEVMYRAQRLGLSVKDVVVEAPTPAGLGRALGQAAPAEVVNLSPFLPVSLLQLLYAASDAVLANSGREPFGLVGLEAMAAAGVVLTGATGEDYAVHLDNAIVLDTADAEEAAWYVRYLRRHPAVVARIKRGARRTARRFVWDRVIENLTDRIALLTAPGDR